jgi:predicted short-subunit dehydrogenase-like oxidoreductase (DUF2520 family)
MGTRDDAIVAIVGPGRVGKAMGKLLLDAGVPVRFAAARQLARARNAVRFIGGGNALNLKDYQLADADVILMTTSDVALAPVARRLACYRKDWSGRVVLHTCGSLPSSVLDPFRKRGASIGSVHPYQTIPNPSAGVRNLPGCFWAVEGDVRAIAIARRWVKAMAGRAFEVPAEAKALYHLSAFLVCPTVVTLMDCSERLLRQAGVPRKTIRPMLGKFVAETARNFAEFGARESLTGPAIRGDWKTLDRHIDELRRFAPDVTPAYIELVNLMLRVAGGAHGSSKKAWRTES